MKQAKLPLDPALCYEALTGLYGSFLDGSGWLREKYERNHRLYLEQTLGRDPGDGRRTGTPVLYATYRTELSDAMDGLPEALFLARSPENARKAQRLTALHRALLERLNFPEEYQRICEYRLRYGVGYCETGVSGGEPTVHAYDPRAVFVDPACEELQEGRAVFKLSCHDPSYFAQRYPQAFPDMDADRFSLPGWTGTGDTIPMLSCYVKERENGKNAVHLIKLAAGQVLYDSRRDCPSGLYRHGEFPFIAWLYDRIPGTPWGFGCFDYLAPVQSYIDKVDTLVLRSLQRTANPRLIVNRAAGIDPDALRDEREEIIEADRVDDGAMRWQPAAPLAPYAMEMLNLKTEMLKRESGQNAASRGELPSMSSSGTAISLLQAAGSKRSNLSQFGINNAFARMVRQIVSNLHEYGQPGRGYRDGDNYLRLEPEDAAGDWEWDLEVRLQKTPQYQSVYQNQLLMQLVQMQALPPRAALDLMDIENKPSILSAMDSWRQEVERNAQRDAQNTQRKEGVKE